MSNDQNPVTPAQAATPGSNEPGQSNPSTATPPATPGAQPEGMVTISTKEFAELQRAKARAAALDRRNALNNANRQPKANATPGDPDDEIAQELNSLRAQVSEKERLLLKERVTNRVRDILDKPEYKELPKSTRELILRNPAVLSNADNEEEALLDIEDYVRENVPVMTAPQQNNQQQSQQQNPKGHETPPAGGNAPAPGQSVFEDTSKLRGDARAMAAFRNVLRKGPVK